jgi:hypothetical protein
MLETQNLFLFTQVFFATFIAIVAYTIYFNFLDKDTSWK